MDTSLTPGHPLNSTDIAFTDCDVCGSFLLDSGHICWTDSNVRYLGAEHLNLGPLWTLIQAMQCAWFLAATQDRHALVIDLSKSDTPYAGHVEYTLSIHSTGGCADCMHHYGPSPPREQTLDISEAACR